MILNTGIVLQDTGRRNKLEIQTLDLLEFEPIRNSIASYAKSPGGAELVRTQGFDTDAALLENKKNIVSDWKKILDSEIKTPDLFFADIDFIEKLEKKGTVLEGIELADAAEFIRSAERLKKYSVKAPDNVELSGALASEAELVPELGDYAAAILKELNPDGSVKENHPLLKSARAKIAGLHSRISKIASKYINDNREIWQSGVAPQRDGRVVLPLKSNFRGRVKGLVHEVSSSGATLFIEPFDLVDLNNELAYEQGMLVQQIFKIYRSLTENLRVAAAELERLVAQVSYIDSWFARAAYSLKNRCIRPLNIEDGIIIKRGRHPLLGDSAVPISLSFNADIRILIITGPNAGGKTVTLKTCGLFVLMNQFACELPAEEGTAVSIYNEIFADIGDDQSIEQSLSTFSGHMKRISAVVGSADNRSLVLLDELGSGTDPSQGSAIAMAVLEYLRSKGISTIVTTHHSAVKNFGYTHPGAINASVSFDSKTMKPTYEIIEGVPGESHAVEIAQSMGLPAGIIQAAENYLDSGDTTVSEMIRELEKRQYEIIERDKRLAENEKQILEERRTLDLTKLKLKQLQHEINLKDYGRLKHFVNESRSELENLVREIREGEITKEKTRKVKQHIAELEAKLEAERSQLESTETELAADTAAGGAVDPGMVLEPGTEVVYRKNRKQGILVEERKSGQWLVAFGNIKLTIDAQQLSPVKQGKTKTSFKASLSGGSFDSTAIFELDIRGMRAVEAENAVIRQIDSALISGLTEFSIIHGTGEGILQKTVQDYLRTCAAVKDFSYSHPDQGGFGKTIVRL